MRILFTIGALLLVLGVASLFVPIPHRERAGIRAGDISLGVETTTRPIAQSPLVEFIPPSRLHSNLPTTRTCGRDRSPSGPGKSVLSLSEQRCRPGR